MRIKFAGIGAIGLAAGAGCSAKPAPSPADDAAVHPEYASPLVDDAELKKTLERAAKTLSPADVEAVLVAQPIEAPPSSVRPAQVYRAANGFTVRWTKGDVEVAVAWRAPNVKLEGAPMLGPHARDNAVVADVGGVELAVVSKVKGAFERGSSERILEALKTAAGKAPRATWVPAEDARSLARFLEFEPLDKLIIGLGYPVEEAKTVLGEGRTVRVGHGKTELVTVAVECTTKGRKTVSLGVAPPGSAFVRDDRCVLALAVRDVRHEVGPVDKALSEQLLRRAFPK